VPFFTYKILLRDVKKNFMDKKKLFMIAWTKRNEKMFDKFLCQSFKSRSRTASLSSEAANRRLV